MKARLKNSKNRKGRYMMKDQRCPYCKEEVDVMIPFETKPCPNCGELVLQEFDETFNGEDVLLRYWLEKAGVQ